MFDAFSRNTGTSYFATRIVRNAFWGISNHPKIMFVQEAFLDLIFRYFIVMFCEKTRLCDPFQNPMGAKTDPKSHKWRHKGRTFHLGCSLLALRKTLKQEETSSGGLRVVYVLRSLSFSNFSDTVIERYEIVLVFAVAPHTSRNTKRIGISKSSGHQNGTQNRPSGAKSIQFLRRRSVSLRS